DFSWLDEVFMHLLANGFQSCLKSGIAGQDKPHGIRLSAAHRADNCETITRMTDVEISNQDVELVLRQQSQRFYDGAGTCDFEPVRLQHRRQSQPDAFFVVNK